jgi:hypothetical protein
MIRANKKRLEQTHELITGLGATSPKPVMKPPQEICEEVRLILRKFSSKNSGAFVASYAKGKDHAYFSS